MAGLLAGDSLHHGMVENGSCSLPQDKPEEGGRWYLSRKEIEENSPSRRDGIDLKKEAYLRKSYCTFLQDLGMRLKVPQVTIATAIIFCHRFFLRQSHAKNDRRIIATVCMFLAGKVEETPRPLKDVILVSYEIINKKDPAAVQRMKQKEVYEQQKELILLGERVVLATLGFDFNVHHPYKPLVEAIKKFKVAQNALAQVAWNFVNDGLRTSLCLQFKPHHIAAGAIFLAAKFLKVKLPSDGEKVWWQEFDVTPRQLEEVSNQMLELYEQNRLPPSQGSEVEVSAGGGSSHRPMTKAPSTNEESGKANGFTQAGGTSSVKPGTSIPLSTRLMPEQSYVDTEGGAQKNIEYQIDDSIEKISVISDHKVDGEMKDHQNSEQEPLPSVRENEGETSNRSMSGLDQQVDEDQERNNGNIETAETGAAPCQSDSTAGRNLEYSEVPVGQSPYDAIKKIDKDKVKAIREKRRKYRGDVPRKTELMDEDDLRKTEFLDEDDLIERVLEDGIELAAENEKIKQERRQSWTKHLNRQELEKPDSGVDNEEDSGDGRNPSENERQSPPGPEVENVEEGEVSLSDDANEGLPTPKSSNRKRKADSPDKNHYEGKQRNSYPSGYHHNHHDISDDGNRMDRLGYAERDHKRLAQENHV